MLNHFFYSTLLHKNMKLKYNIVYFFIRCIPDKLSETCYYLDSSAARVTNPEEKPDEILSLIPDAPKGRD